jgi:hypothetical protein
MDQASPLGGPASQAEREERQCGRHSDRGPARPDQRCDRGQACRLGDIQKSLRGLLVGIDGLLIDSFHFPNRIRRFPAAEKHRDRRQRGEENDGQGRAEERLASESRGRKQQRRREELPEEGSVVEHQMDVHCVWHSQFSVRSSRFSVFGSRASDRSVGSVGSVGSR